MLCAVTPDDAERLVAHLTEAGETAAIVGRLTERTADPVIFTGTLAL